MNDLSNRANLFFFTAEFPYAIDETFIENEIFFLSKSFNKVFIIPYLNTASSKRSLPENFNVIDRKRTGISSNSSSIQFSRHFFLITKILFQEFLHCNNKWFFLKNIKLWNSYLIKAFHDADFIDEQFKISGTTNAVVYSFWMNDWVLALSVLKEQKKIDKFIFRCGGFDIWDERHQGNYLPFRYFNYKNASKIMPNSMLGEVYIKNKKIFSDKVQCRYWGTKDHGLNPFDRESAFTIVSCSNVIPLKRVELIVDILKNISFQVNWIHFGDGELLNEIKQQSKGFPENIIVNFKGRVSNKDVLDFYMKNSVNLFITTSSTESLPVSIQEAISFGIPVIATDVGGMSEIVNDQTGILIEKDFNSNEVARKIIDFKNGSGNTMEFRNGVRAFWKKTFDAEVVYEEFCKEIKNYVN